MAKSIFTISSLNYLKKSHLALESFARYNSGYDIYMIVCDKKQDIKNFDKSYKMIFAEDILDPNELLMSFYYNVTEFNTAVKPFTFSWLFNKGYDTVFYFDPDILFYDSIDDIEAALRGKSCILTPHILKPTNPQLCWNDQSAFVKSGQFNLGFVGFTKNSESLDLLNWWKSKLIDKCLFEHDLKYFVDQSWASLFASFTERLAIYRNPGANVAYWNLYERSISFNNDQFLVDNRPLIFFHFSGFNERDLTRPCKYFDNITISSDGAAYQLMHNYLKLLHSNSNLPSLDYYSFDYYNDGSKINPQERRHYLNLDKKEKDRMGNPFSNKEKLQSEAAHPSQREGEGQLHPLIFKVGTKIQETFYSLPHPLKRVLKKTIRLVIAK